MQGSRRCIQGQDGGRAETEKDGQLAAPASVDFWAQCCASQGSKIRATYIAFAQKEKKRLEEEIAASAQEIATREKEVARLRGTLGASGINSIC